MKITRSSKCSTKWTTAAKRRKLDAVLREYGRVVNIFIDEFWKNCPEKKDLLKPIVDLPETWLSARLRKVAAREAVDMVKSVRENREWNLTQLQQSIEGLERGILKNPGSTRKQRRRRNHLYKLRKAKLMKLGMVQPHKPKHRGRSMSVSCTIAELQPAYEADGFDAWLHLGSIGSKIIMDLPIRFHKHFNSLNQVAKRLNSYVIHKDYVQFAFEIETGPKKKPQKLLGIDTGIKKLAACSDGSVLGADVEACLDRIKRCRHGSRGHKRAQRALRQRIDEVARDVASSADLVVVENLKGISNQTKVKRRLTKNIRRSIGAWNQRYWLQRLEQRCERNRVSFRTVSASYTSQQCSSCGSIDERNRNGEKFLCLKCFHSDDADINAAQNILDRFLAGPYGAGFKTK